MKHVKLKTAKKIMNDLVHHVIKPPFPLIPIKSRLEVVVFDLDDALFGTTNNVERARRKACRSMLAEAKRVAEISPRVKQALIDNNLYSECAVSLILQPELERVAKELGPNAQNHYNTLWERMGVDNSDYNGYDALIVQAGVDAYHDVKKTFYLNRNVIETITELKLGHDLRLAIVTGCGDTKKQREKVELLQLNELPFKAIKYVTDGRKDLALEMLVRELGVNPENAMYWGDRLNDMEAANAAGLMRAYYFNMLGKYCTNRFNSGESLRKKVQIPNYFTDDVTQLIEIVEDNHERF